MSKEFRDLNEQAEQYKVEELKERPSNGTPKVYVTIHEGVGGWNSSVWQWAGDDPDGFPGYEPSHTGHTNTSFNTGRREDAIREARYWAECEDLPLWLPTRGV